MWYPLQDLNREVVKSEYAVFSIPHLDFEQPASKQGGNIHTHMHAHLQNNVKGTE